MFSSDVLTKTFHSRQILATYYIYKSNPKSGIFKIQYKGCIYNPSPHYEWSSLADSVSKESLQCRRPGFNPWVRKIPWRRKWQPTPVFLPGKSSGQRSLVGYSPWCRRVRHNWATKLVLLMNSKPVLLLSEHWWKEPLNYIPSLTMSQNPQALRSYGSEAFPTRSSSCILRLCLIE